MSFEQESPITETGNISLHGREGMPIIFGVQDEQGADRDLSTASLFFEVEGVFRAALGGGTINTERMITITADQVSELHAAVAWSQPGLAFVVRDETGAIPVVLWEGFILVRGFTEQPS